MGLSIKEEFSSTLHFRNFFLQENADPDEETNEDSAEKSDIDSDQESEEDSAEKIDSDKEIEVNSE